MSKNTSYVSVGTIRCMVTASPQEQKFFFVPDNDHCVKHSKTSYAAFVVKSGGADLCGWELEDGEVTLSNVPTEVMAAVLAAATSQMKVEVTVSEGDSTLDLVAITVPPKSNT